MSDLLDDAGLDLLLAPLSAAHPCGADINGGMTYASIREARRADGPNQGVWEKTVAKRAEWDLAEQLCMTCLRQESKDLNVCAWLCEAWIHQHGLAGLADGLTLMDAMLTTYWEQVHPLPEGGDLGFRSAPFEWLNRNVPLALRSAELAPGTGPGGNAFTLAEWDAVLRAERQLARVAAAKPGRPSAPPALAPEQTGRIHFAAAAAMAPHDYYPRLAAQLERCGQAAQQLGKTLTSSLGKDAPSLTALWDVLRSCVGAAEELGGAAPPAVDAVSEISDQAGYGGDLAGAPAHRHGIVSRAQAYMLLAEVADYLHYTEPHSPVPYLVRRACAWGDMPLEELLVELLDNESNLKQIFRLLGTGRQ
jgi:type VI secretion system protein ImpA